MRQRDIEALALIADFLEANGYAISVRELTAAMGLSSPATTHTRLSKLRKDGLIADNCGEARTTHLTDAGKCALTTERMFGTMGAE